MKKLYIPLLLLLFVSCNSSSISVPQLKFGGLKGNVASIKYSRFEAEMKFGDIFPGDLDVVIRQDFDADGNLTFEGRYYDDGGMLYETRQTFEKGQWVSSVIKNSYGEPTNQKVLERGKNYLKYESKTGEEISTFETKYDVLQSRTYSENGTLVADLTFNKNGQLLEQKNYDESGKIIFRIVQEYDDKNFLVKSTSYGESWDEHESYTYKEFDKKGNWITQIVYDEDGDAEYIVKREITYR